MMKENVVSVNDFFCGAGGMGLGFKYAGFQLAGAWDFDKYAVESYRHNVSPIVKQADITQMTWDEIPYADVWTFGFPCQDISVAGKQAGMVKGKTRSGLFYEVMRLLEETEQNQPERLPKVLLAENVKAVKKYLPEIEKEYKARGYRMYATLYNSKYWGVPQNRERYFMIGIHESIEEEFVFPEQQTDFIPKLSSILETEVDEKYYISDEKALKIIEQAKEGLRVKQATKKGYDVAVEGDSINLSHPNSKTRRGRVGKQVAQTLLTSQEQVVVESLNGVHGLVARDYKGFGNQAMNAVIDGFRVRRLTPREYARLQGFPDSYKQVVSNTQFYKQMGNAVTVTVAQAIAERIKEFLINVAFRR